MSIVNIERNRNKYTFTFDNGKVASVDLDNRETPYIGVSGKAVKNFPSSIQGILKTLLSDAVSWHRSSFRGKEYIDRTISLPDVSLSVKCDFFVLLYDEAGNHEWMNAHWGEIVALMRDYSTRGARVDFRSIYSKINDKKIIDLLAKYNMEECEKYLLPMLNRHNDFIHFLEIKAFRAAIRNACKDKYEKSHKAVIELFGCDNPDTLAETFGIRFLRHDINRAVENVFYTMANAEELVRLMGYENYQYTNIERDYQNLKTTYEREKTEIENRNFRKNQMKYNLHFQYGDYEIFVPTTREELAKIGNTFHNCANGWEWDNRLKRGQYALVVVRNSNTEEMKVCVDICLSTLEIGQYYKEYNGTVTGRPLLKFKEQYQIYLDGLKEV